MPCNWTIIESGRIIFYNNNGGILVEIDDNAPELEIRLVATNSCGSAYINRVYDLSDCRGDFERAFSISLNPSTGNFLVTLEATFNIETLSKIIFLGLDNQNLEFSKEDFVGNQLEINATGLPNGVYYILLADINELIYSHQVQIINN